MNTSLITDARDAAVVARLANEIPSSEILARLRAARSAYEVAVQAADTKRTGLAQRSEAANASVENLSQRLTTARLLAAALIAELDAIDVSHIVAEAIAAAGVSEEDIAKGA